IAGHPALVDPVEDVPVRGVPDRSELVGLLRIARERRVVRQAELLVAIALPLVALGQDLLALLARVPHGALHACRRPSPARVLSRQPRSGEKRAVRVAKRPRLAPEQRVVPVTHHGSRRARAGSPALAPLAGRAELVEPGLTIREQLPRRRAIPGLERLHHLPQRLRRRRMPRQIPRRLDPRRPLRQHGRDLIDRRHRPRHRLRIHHRLDPRQRQIRHRLPQRITPRHQGRLVHLHRPVPPPHAAFVASTLATVSTSVSSANGTVASKMPGSTAPAPIRPTTSHSGLSSSTSARSAASFCSTRTGTPCHRAVITTSKISSHSAIGTTRKCVRGRTASNPSGTSSPPAQTSSMLCSPGTMSAGASGPLHRARAPTRCSGGKYTREPLHPRASESR